MAEETAAEGKTLRMTTGDTNNEARVEETQRRDGHAQDEDTEEGEKTEVGGGGSVVGAKHCYKQSVQTHGDEDEVAARAERGRGRGDDGE